jgi:hypothetical protein
VTVIRVDPVLLESCASRIEAQADSLRDIREAMRAGQQAPSYDGQFGPHVQAINSEAWSRISVEADRLEALADVLRRKADEFATADRWSNVGVRWTGLGGIAGATTRADDVPWWLGLLIGVIPEDDLLALLHELELLGWGQAVSTLLAINRASTMSQLGPQATATPGGVQPTATVEPVPTAPVVPEVRGPRPTRSSSRSPPTRRNSWPKPLPRRRRRLKMRHGKRTPRVHS